MSINIYYVPEVVVKVIKSKLSLLVKKENIENSLLIRYLYVINRLYKEKVYYKDRYHDKGVPINIKKLAEKIGVKDGVATMIIRNLREWCIIEMVQEYKVGKTAGCIG